jgi:hypothetical protein
LIRRPFQRIRNLNYVDTIIACDISYRARYARVEEEGKTGKVLVHGVIRAEAIQRIYVAAREADNSMSGKFTDVSPPTR